MRRLVSEAKKFATESAWTVINHAMQVLGGIGYTDIYPVERLLRDCRLITIWTGTNEIMNLRHPARVLPRVPRRARRAAATSRPTPPAPHLPDEKVYNEPE